MTYGMFELFSRRKDYLDDLEPYLNKSMEIISKYVCVQEI